MTDAIVEQADVESAITRLGELLDESVVVDKAETFKAKQLPSVCALRRR